MRALLFALILNAGPAFADDAGKALLVSAQADRAVVDGGLTLRVDIDRAAGSKHETSALSVAIRGEDVRITALSPPEHAGEILLLTGGKAWFSRPGLKRPTPVSRQEVLGGKARAGDLLVALSRLDTLYDATVGGTEALAGVATTKLTLKATSPDAPAPAATVWLTTDHRMVQMTLLDAAGKVDKTAGLTWGGTVTVNGKAMPFPSAMSLVEAGGAVTTVRYSAPIAGALADALFSPASLTGSP